MPIRTHDWQGASLNWFTHTVRPIDALPDFGACNYVFVRRRPDGTAEPVYIGQTGDGGQRGPDHEKLNLARFSGATEIHIYVGAWSKQGRLDVETDLRNGHWTPLNEQPTKAPVIGRAHGTAPAFGFSGFGTLPIAGLGIASTPEPSIDNPFANAPALFALRPSFGCDPYPPSAALSPSRGIADDLPAENGSSAPSGLAGVLAHGLGLAPTADYFPFGFGGMVANPTPPTHNPLAHLSEPSPSAITSPLAAALLGIARKR